MPTIQLTDNTTLNLAASGADGTATLNRYLKHPLTFLTPSGLNAIVNQKIEAVDTDPFPIKVSATGAGTFAVEGSSLVVNLGVSAVLNLLKDSDASDLCKSMQLPAANFVSFGLQGTLSAGPTLKGGDFCFGITDGTTVTVTNCCPAADTETLADAVKRAIAGLTIPHDLADLKSLPPSAICKVEASSCLKFTASVTYSILKDPLATAAVAVLPKIAVTATSGATLEATVSHTSGHTITLAKLANGRIHLAVSFTKTDDFETSLTVSAGLTATVGSQDALAFLLGKIGPNSQAEMVKIKAEAPAKAKELSTDIKAAVDASLCSTLQASLKVALDQSQSSNRLFLYEIDLNAIDADGSAALQAALTGDFTALTASNATLAGIQLLDSALTNTAKVTHSLTLHLLGIFNYATTNAFIEKTTVDYTKDTHEIVLSDETIKIVGNNLDAEKLRDVVVKGITLTLPAAANTPAADTPLNLQFFDRQASASPSLLRQFANVLEAMQAPDAAAAIELIKQNRKDYGIASLFLGLNLTPQQCRQFFLDAGGKSYDWTTYTRYACDAQATILANDPDNADRHKLFTLGLPFWRKLQEAGARPNVIRLLTPQGIREEAAVDVTAVLWWSGAMANYGRALAANQDLVKVGTDLVLDSTGGFDEPWLILAAWNMLGKPALQSMFSCSVPPRASAAS